MNYFCVMINLISTVIPENTEIEWSVKIQNNIKDGICDLRMIL